MDHWEVGPRNGKPYRLGAHSEEQRSIAHPTSIDELQLPRYGVDGNNSRVCSHGNTVLDVKIRRSERI
jgi:hypothetical protein